MTLWVDTNKLCEPDCAARAGDSVVADSYYGKSVNIYKDVTRKEVSGSLGTDIPALIINNPVMIKGYEDQEAYSIRIKYGSITGYISCKYIDYKPVIEAYYNF